MEGESQDKFVQTEPARRIGAVEYSNNASEAYKKGDVKKEELVKIADRKLSRNDYQGAILDYETAEDKEKLISTGDKAYSLKYFDIAANAYIRAFRVGLDRKNFDLDKIQTCLDYYLDKFNEYQDKSPDEVLGLMQILGKSQPIENYREDYKHDNRYSMREKEVKEFDIEVDKILDSLKKS